MEGKIFLSSLSAFTKFGPRRLEKLKNFFTDWEKAFNSSLSNLCAAGIEKNIAESFLEERKKIIPEKIAQNLLEEEIEIIAFDDQKYPEQLKQISDPPALLYVRGNLNSGGNLLAVVGARKNTPYGERAINNLLPSVINKGVGIVSGLAIGTDARAHEKTLACGGYTIAILGTGIDKKSIYPLSNKKLSEDIINSGGAVISEFPPETPPLKPHFPLRNRIISGLSQGVLVIEAGVRSGSLITAHLALDENREVLAVPGSIFSPQSEGPNNLIKKGAKTVLEPNDILEIFDLQNEPNSPVANNKNSQNTAGLSEIERLILANLSEENTTADELREKAKLDIREINSTLSILEIKGLIKNNCGRYSIC